MIVKLANGRYLMGYSHYRWNEKSWPADDYIKDNEKRSCLMSLDTKMILAPSTDQNLIYCNDKWGPCFGAGELKISNECNINGDSEVAVTKGTYTYNIKEQKEYKRLDEEVMMSFAGVRPNLWNVKVLEYEVFKVCF
mgnify:CR=1 FL=1